MMKLIGFILTEHLAIKKKKKNYIQENVYFPIFKLSSTTSNMDLLIL